MEHTKNLSKLNLAGYSDKQLILVMENTIKKFRRSASYIFLSHALDEYFEEWINKKLDRKSLNQLQKDEFFQILSIPKKNSGLINAQNNLKKIASAFKGKNYNKTQKLIKNYISEFKWLGYDTGLGNDLTISEVKSKINSILGHEKRKNKNKSRSKSRGYVIKELKLGRRDVEFLEIMWELIYLRTYRVECHMVAGSQIRPLIEELGRRLNTDYKNITQLTFDEIKKSIKSKKVDFEEIRKRKEKYGLLMINGKKYDFSSFHVILPQRIAAKKE